MKKIENVKDLRDNLLNELNSFCENKTDDSLDKLGTISKVSSIIIRTAKLEFDNEQKKHYLTKLNEWIDSDEYSLATMKVRNVIIAEQKRISKQIKD